MFGRKENPARYGERTIVITVRFWTNKIAEKRGHVIPKVCWDKGVIDVLENHSHGLKRLNDPIPFNSIAEIPAKIEQIFKQKGIKVLHGSTTRKIYPRPPSCES
jgi:hypothetical protein